VNRFKEIDNFNFNMTLLSQPLVLVQFVSKFNSLHKRNKQLVIIKFFMKIQILGDLMISF